jgi:cytochrome P450
MDSEGLVPNGGLVRGADVGTTGGEYDHAEIFTSNWLIIWKSPKETSSIPDVAHYLLQDARDDPQRFPWLTGDGILAIVAGSEPTAAVLVGLFCELSKEPRHTEIILDEIRAIDIADLRALASSCPHLEASIFEALRLYPALPTGGTRKTLEKGIMVAGMFIPPETTVVAPRFCISRRKCISFALGMHGC